MPRTRLSPEERTERRREAALKGVRTRESKARIDEFLNDVAESVTYRARACEGRKVVERAQSIGREGDLYYTVHVRRWPWKPSCWTPEIVANYRRSWTVSSAPTARRSPYRTDAGGSITMYKIVRFYQIGPRRRTIKTGLTLAEARAHCRDPETSSKTATSAAASAGPSSMAPGSTATWNVGSDPISPRPESARPVVPAGAEGMRLTRR